MNNKNKKNKENKTQMRMKTKTKNNSKEKFRKDNKITKIKNFVLRTYIGVEQSASNVIVQENIMRKHWSAIAQKIKLTTVRSKSVYLEMESLLMFQIYNKAKTGYMESKECRDMMNN